MATETLQERTATERYNPETTSTSDKTIPYNSSPECPSPDCISQDFINELVSTGDKDYCTIRNALYEAEILDRINVPCPYETGCRGRGWCEYRARAFERFQKRKFLTQFKLIEIYKYLEGLHGHTIQEKNEAVIAWANSGAGATFRYAFEEVGIRDLSRLIELCAFAAVDARPIRDEGQQTLAA